LAKYKVVKQQGIKDCGAAALLSIIRYYKGNTTLEKVIEYTNTTKKGTTAYHLIKGAEKLGCEAEGIKCQGLLNIKTPCIAHVILNNSYHHFVVIFEINHFKKEIIIGDPAMGIKKYSFANFQKIWTDIIISIEPKRIIKEKIDSPLTFLSEFAIKNKENLTSMFLYSLLFVIFNILGSFYLKYIIDIYNDIFISNFYLVSIVFLILIIFKLIFAFIREYINMIIDKNINYLITTKIFSHILKLPYKFYKNRTTGEIVQRVGDISKITSTISKLFLTLCIDVLLSLFSLVFLFYISKELFIIAIIIILLYVLIFLVFNKFFTIKIDDIYYEKDKTTNLLIESITGFETIKNNGVEDKVIYKFKNKYLNLLQAIFNLEKLYAFQNYLKDNVYNIGFLAILFFGINLVSKKVITLGELITFNSILIYFIDPIRDIIDSEYTFKDGYKATKRIIEILSLEKEDNKHKVLNKAKTTKITFRNLSFSYDDKDIILDNINLEIKEKRNIIYGASGSGKSTLVKLLFSYFDIKRNTILINDNDIKDISNIKNKIIFSSQNEKLFNESIYNNIDIYRDCNRNMILKICKICEIDKILINKNIGYDYIIEENGFNFSGGEKQRIILARSLLKKGDIIILDETLSEVDIKSERNILESIFREFPDKIVIYISHRLANIDLFDSKIALSKGKVVINNAWLE